MNLQKHDYYAIACFALAGMFNALMDYNLWERHLGGGWMTNVFEALGLKGWFLAEGGNAVWRKFWLVWDAWHLFKNLMWVSIGVGIAFVARDWRWGLSVLIITSSFVIFYHLVFGAPTN